MTADHNILQNLVNLNSDTSQCIPILYALTLTIRPKKILELGVRQGVSTRALLVACRATGSQLISVDTDPCNEVKNVIHSLRLWDYWTFLQLNDRRLLNFWKYGRVGMVFLDTDHDYKHTLAELGVCHKLLSRKGVILVHDTLAPNYPDLIRAIKEFLLKHKKKYWFYELGTQYGLGMLYKR